MLSIIGKSKANNDTFFDDYMKRNGELYPWERDATFLNKDSLWIEFYLTKAEAFITNDNDSALHFLKIAEKKIQNKNYTRLIPELYSKYGNYYFFIDKQDTAIYYFKAAAKMAEKEKDTLTAGISFSNLALIYSYQSQYDKFLTSAQNAIIYNNLLNRHIANMKIWTALSDYYSHEKDTLKAEHASYMALRAADLSKNFVWQPWAKNQYALLLLDFGKIEKADSLISELLPIADTIYYKKLSKNIYKTKAVILNLQKDGNRAIQFLNKAKDAAPFSSTFDSLDYEMSFADAYAIMNKHQFAIDIYRGILSVKSDVLDLELKLKTYDKLIASLQATNQYKELSYVWARRTEIANELLNSRNIELTKKYEVELNLQDKELQTKKAELQAQEAEEKTTYLAFSSVILAFIVLSIILRMRIAKKQSALQFRNNELQKTIELNEQKNLLKQKENELFEQTKALAEKQEIVNRLEEEITKSKSLNMPTYSIEQILSEIQQNNMTIESFDLKFNEIYPDFYTRLYQTCSDLSQSEIRVCALIKMNMNTKEIANLLNVSPSTIDNHRFRVRKKLELEKGTNLFDAIQNLDNS